MLLPQVYTALAELILTLDELRWPGATKRRLRWLRSPIACVKVGWPTEILMPTWLGADHLLYEWVTNDMWCKYRPVSISRLEARDLKKLLDAVHAQRDSLVATGQLLG